MARFQIVPDLSQPEQSRCLAERYGLGYEYHDFFSPAVLEDREETARLIALAQKGWQPQDLTLHGAFFDVIVFSPDPRIAEISQLRVSQSLAIARKLGARGVVVHSNLNPFLTGGDYRAGWLEKSVAFYGTMLREYPELELWLENMFDAGPEPLAELAEQLSVHANFGLCLDYGHAALSPTPLKTWAKRLGPYIRHGHINDHDGKNDLHLPVGSGCLDWGEFARLRAAYFPEAGLLVEVRGAAGQQQSLDYLNRMGLL